MKRVALLCAVAVLAIAIAVGVVVGFRHSRRPAAGVTLPRLDHVVVVVFENEEASSVIGRPDAPTFTRYAHLYANLTDYNAVAHPSLPNYLALASGSTQGVTDDCTGCGPWPTSIGTELTKAGLSWEAYAQGYPSSPLFVKRHVPFLYFTDGAGHVKPLSALDVRHLPAFAFVTPNLCNDGHNCPIATADRFLARFLPPLLHTPRTAVFVVFDEGTTDQEGGGEIPAFVAGTAVRKQVVDSDDVTHYGVLRTIEDLLGLPPLGRAKGARPVTGIWR